MNDHHSSTAIEEPKTKADPRMMPCVSPDLIHEWRIADGFFVEVSKKHRVYGAYCVLCTRPCTIEIIID